MPGLDLVQLFREDVHQLEKRGQEYVCLCPFHDEKTPSCTIKPKADRPFYRCFGCGAHGDAVDYLVKHRKMEMKDALAMRDKAEGRKPQRKDGAAQQTPAPAQQEPVSTQQNQDSHLAKAEFIEKLPDNHEGRYVYRDAKGNVRFVVQRYVIEGKKTFGQYTRAAKKGVKGWLKALAMKENRPLYRLAEVLKVPNDRRIMVVEGEKCAEAVAASSMKALPVCWSSGTQSWRRTDWSPLHGHPALLVADGDVQGHKCMREIARFLAPHCPEIMLVLPPLPEKGKKARDIADEIEDRTDINDWLRDHGEFYDPDQTGDNMRESLPPDPSEDDDDEWALLIATAKDSPGVFYLPDTVSKLVALKRSQPDEWMNLRYRIRGHCPGVLLPELDKAMNRLEGGMGRALKANPSNGRSTKHGRRRWME